MQSGTGDSRHRPRYQGEMRHGLEFARECDPLRWTDKQLADCKIGSSGMQGDRMRLQDQELLLPRACVAGVPRSPLLDSDRQNLFNIHEVSRIAAGIAGGAILGFLTVMTGFLEAIERKIFE